MGQTQILVITLVWKNWPLKQAEKCVLWLYCHDIVEKLFNVLRNSTTLTTTLIHVTLNNT